MFRHPSYYAKIKKENRLTKKENYDKGIDNEIEKRWEDFNE